MRIQAENRDDWNRAIKRADFKMICFNGGGASHLWAAGDVNMHIYTVALLVHVELNDVLN